MTDYTKTTGVNGRMTIRDTGDWVEFYFQAGYSSDWWNGMPFNWTANGTTTSKTINYPTGRPFYHVGSVLVKTTQTVTFRLTDHSSASGIGGPTSFSHIINRDTAPKPPSTPKLSGITDTSVVVKFTDGDNGGDAIDSRQIGYSSVSSTSPTGFVSSDGSTTVTGLQPGKTYYFWARTHNSVGWSDWSGRASAKTLKVPNAPTTPLLSSITATSVDVSFTPNSDNGSPITGFQIGYGTDAFTPTSTVPASSPQVVTGLIPGTTYYFFARAQNAVGWSAWSAPASAQTVAGARIKVGTTWVLAVPYVRVGGVWKIAETWVRNVGEWKRTI